MRLSKCLLEGPKNGAFRMLGEPEGCREGGLPARVLCVGRWRQNSQRFFGIVTQLLRELPSERMENLLGRSRLCRAADGREQGPRGDAYGGRFEVDSARCLGWSGTGAG
jgi:hypothetical protein